MGFFLTDKFVPQSGLHESLPFCIKENDELILPQCFLSSYFTKVTDMTFALNIATTTYCRSHSRETSSGHQDGKYLVSLNSQSNHSSSVVWPSCTSLSSALFPFEACQWSLVCIPYHILEEYCVMGVLLVVLECGWWWQRDCGEKLLKISVETR